MIQEFCIANQKEILEEIESLGDVSVGKWILDVTGACLNAVLWHWGAKFESLCGFQVSDFATTRELRLYRMRSGSRFRRLYRCFGQLSP